MFGNTTPPKGRYGVYVPYVLLLADFVVLNAVMLVVLFLNAPLEGHTLRTLVVIANAAYMAVVRMALPLRRERAIHMDRLVVRSLQMVLLHAVFFFAIIAFLEVDNVPWEDYAEFYVAFAVMLPLSWIVTRLALKALRRRGRNYVNVIIIGYGDTAARLADALQQDPGYGYRIAGFFDRCPPENSGSGCFLGTIDNLDAYLNTHPVNEIYYTLDDGGDEDTMQAVVRLADERMLSFYYVPPLSHTVARTFHLATIGTLPILAAHNNPLDNPVNRGVKRTFDLVVASVAMIFSPFVFIPVAIAIKASSPGPVLFRQRRTGYRGNEFTCLKFRTMRVNADADRSQATADDPRKTRVGDFLRRTSIDELPQLINVLRGEMSLVGPRPHMVRHTADYSRLIERYMLRHVIKPGITGWAQVTGYRGATSELWQMEGRVEKDVWYIENWSLMLDVKIIVRTVSNAIRGEENAY